MYKVGDLGVFDYKGEIICHGRVDNQVKIRQKKYLMKKKYYVHIMWKMVMLQNLF